MLWHATMMCLQGHSWGTLLRSRLSATLLWVFLEPIPLSCTVAASGAKKNLCLLQLVWFRVAKDLEQSYWHQAAHEETTVRLDHVQANKGLDQVLTLVWGTPAHTSAFLPWRCTLDNDLITCLVFCLIYFFLYRWRMIIPCISLQHSASLCLGDVSTLLKIFKGGWSVIQFLELRLPFLLELRFYRKKKTVALADNLGKGRGLPLTALHYAGRLPLQRQQQMHTKGLEELSSHWGR